MADPPAETPDPLESNGAPELTGPPRDATREQDTGSEIGVRQEPVAANSDVNSPGDTFSAKAESKDNRASRMSLRLAGSGMELASFTLIVGAVGYGVDMLRGHTQLYAAATGTLVGFSLGLYRMIALVIQESNE